MGSESEAVLGREDPRRSRTLTALRELALARSDDITDVLGPATRVNSQLDGELYRRRLADDHGVAATLAKLFRLTLSVSLEDATRALAPLRPEDLAELDLASVEKDAVTPPRQGIYYYLVGQQLGI